MTTRNTATGFVTANKTDVFQHSQCTEVRKDDYFNVETSSVQGVHKCTGCTQIHYTSVHINNTKHI